MRLHVIARGKIGRSPEAELVARYEKRIAWPLKLTELPETFAGSKEPLMTVLRPSPSEHWRSPGSTPVLAVNSSVEISWAKR